MNICGKCFRYGFPHWQGVDVPSKSKTLWFYYYSRERGWFYDLHCSTVHHHHHLQIWKGLYGSSGLAFVKKAQWGIQLPASGSVTKYIFSMFWKMLCRVGGHSSEAWEVAHKTVVEGRGGVIPKIASSVKEDLLDCDALCKEPIWI